MIVYDLNLIMKKPYISRKIATKKFYRQFIRSFQTKKKAHEFQNQKFHADRY